MPISIEIAPVGNMRSVKEGYESSLSKSGWVPREMVNLGEVLLACTGLGKTSISPLLHPNSADFREGRVRWFCARKEGSPVAVGAMRVDAPTGSFRDCLAARYAAAYGTLAPSVAAPICAALSAGGVYFGDLAAAGRNAGDAKNLSNLIAWGHCTAQILWNAPHHYAFLRHRDVLRGASDLYGFTESVVSPLLWENPPPPRSNTELLCYVKRDDIVSKLALKKGHR